MLQRTWLLRCSSTVGATGTLVAQFGRFRVVNEAAKFAPGVLRVEMSTRKEDGGSKVNLMNEAFFDDLNATFDWISMDAEVDVRACVLHTTLPSAEAGQTHFCCGLDLKAVGPKLLSDLPVTQAAKLAVTTTLGMSPPALTEPGLPAMRSMKIRRLIHQWQKAITSVAACRVPVIAAVHGLCIGGGVDLTSACDMRFASTESELSVKEAHVGIVADLGSLQRVGRIVGEGTLREWAYTARNVAAEDAKRRLFYNEVLESPERCLDHALGVARDIAVQSSPMAVQGTKAVLNYASETEARRGLEHVQLWNSAFLKSDDLVEAAVSFAQKRKPKFAGSSRVHDRRKKLGAGSSKQNKQAANTATVTPIETGGSNPASPSA